MTCEIGDAVMPVVMFSTGRNVCFTSMSRHRQHGWLRPLSASFRLMHRSKQQRYSIISSARC
jgi:hypothetical protein